MCIHGHFYQPPRENPWLETIEMQESAQPYHDWNERITAECYEPNSASRILDGDGRIVKIENNYASISFNFGPTLLTWLQEKAPKAYAFILEADRRSKERFSGHGSAIAQPYNHMIMPLANQRDKATQVAWGIADFKMRFGRRPRGMWLPETAVDIETLEVLAEQGIEFTILAPHQALEVRPHDGEWSVAVEEKLNGAYRLELRDGRAIDVFFYNGPVSRAVAFDGILQKGEDFAHSLLSAFQEGEGELLVNVAADGETYGHHHRHGDMALAYALYHIDGHQEADITNYAEYLDRHPPSAEIRINENTSWSCVHGIERWRSNCGCSTGGGPGWHQKWRGPLRDALDWLRDELAPRYERMAGELFKDPWGAREDYIQVILNRSEDNVRRFLEDQARRPLTPEEEVTGLKLLEIQRHAMLMYTSCGWFFNDISGIETVQVLQYAGRVLQLLRDLSGEDLEAGFLERLEQATSNVPEQGNGRRIYERMVRPAMVDLSKVAAHYALNSLFSDYPGEARIHSYIVEKKEFQRLESGGDVMALGWGRVSSIITRESEDLAFAAVSLRNHELKCGVRSVGKRDSHAGMVEKLREVFRENRTDTGELLDREFGGNTYRLGSLFKDHQRAILSNILDRSMDESAAAYRWVYRNQAPLMGLLRENGVTLPEAFSRAAEFVLNMDLRIALGGQVPDLERATALLQEVGDWGVSIEMSRLLYAIDGGLDRLATQFRDVPDSESLRKLGALVDFSKTLPFDVDLRHAQNACFQVLNGALVDLREKAESGDKSAAELVDGILHLAENLYLKVS